MKRSNLIALTVCCLALFTFVVGCSEPIPTANGTQTAAEDGHSHGEDGHGAESFDDVFAEVEEMKEAICTAFLEDKAGDAHDHLHKIGHSLEELPALAAKDKELTEEQTAAVKSAVESLFDGFTKLDDVMHGGEGVDIQEVTDGLTQALASLKEATE